MNQILNVLGNIICVSIPEEFFISFLILYLVKIFRIQNHDFFDINNDFRKKLVKLMLISVIPLAVISNLLFFTSVNSNISGLIGIVLTTLSIIIYLKIDIKKYTKIIFIFLVCILTFAIFMVIEECTMKLVFYVTKIPREYFLQTFGLRFLLTLFERVIEYVFVVFVLFNKNCLVKTNIIKTVMKSKWLFLIFTLYIFLNGTTLIIFCNGVFTEQILQHSNELYKVFWILGMFVLITFDICTAWLIAMLIQIKERYKYKYGKEAKI